MSEGSVFLPQGIRIQAQDLTFMTEHDIPLTSPDLPEISAGDTHSLKKWLQRTLPHVSKKSKEFQASMLHEFGDTFTPVF